LLPLSAYLDFNNGSDTTGVIENAKAFKTIQALLTALPRPVAKHTQFIFIREMLVLRENGKAKFKIYFVCRYNLNFDTVKEADGITTPDFLFSDAGGTDRTWTFENSNISFQVRDQ
jgi:hypothetical protein